MEITVKALKESISKLLDDDVLIFENTFKIRQTREYVFDFESSIPMTDKGNDYDLDSRKIANNVDAEKEVPQSFVIPKKYMEYLGWKNDSLTNTKISNFVITLLNVWSPYSDINTVPHNKLNDTTLSRALFVTATNGKTVDVNDVNYNIDSIIDDIILFNIDFLKAKYNFLHKQ